MVTCMHVHPSGTSRSRHSGERDEYKQGRGKLGQLLLTAGCLDWVLRLWRLSPISPHDPTPTQEEQQKALALVLQLQTPDGSCVCDVQWNSRYPAVFACITSAGQVCVCMCIYECVWMCVCVLQEGESLREALTPIYSRLQGACVESRRVFRYSSRFTADWR